LKKRVEEQNYFSVSQMTIVSISAVGPYDLRLSLRVWSSFAPGPFRDMSVLRSAVRIHDNSTVLELSQVGHDAPTLEIRYVLPDRGIH